MAKMVYITQNVPDVPDVPTKKYNLIYGERHTQAAKRYFISLAYKNKKPGTLGTMGTKYKKHSVFNGFLRSRF
jgi:hypothetical protein